MAEQGRRWSPYAYAMDNPVYFIDPDGMWPWPSWNQVKSFASGVGHGAVNYVKGVGTHIKNEVKGLANAYTSPKAAIKFAVNHSGPVIIGKTIANNISTPYKIVSNIVQGNYGAAGEAYGEHLAAAATVIATEGAVRTVGRTTSAMSGSFAAEVPAAEAPVTNQLYKRPNNATTPAQRASARGDMRYLW